MMDALFAGIQVLLCDFPANDSVYSCPFRNCSPTAGGIGIGIGGPSGVGSGGGPALRSRSAAYEDDLEDESAGGLLQKNHKP